MPDNAEVTDRAFLDALRRWALAQVPGAAAVADVHPMPGNSGLSFGFDVLDERGATLAALVIRMSPPGVRRSGNTDVLRQVPLLRAAGDFGVPVAEVMWFSPDETWFGTDAIIQRRLAARPLHMMKPEASVAEPGDDIMPFLRRAVEVLAHIHRLPWRQVLASWEEPKIIADELAFWTRILAKSPEPRWAEIGNALSDTLRATVPGDTDRVGLFHGDYQTNNILYEPDATIAAVVDWEIAGIGSTFVDIGWFAMMTDLTCWHDEHGKLLLVTADPEDLLRWYQEAAGLEVPHYDWYRAYAIFKFATIATFNVRLHRTGRRVDPAYDELVPSIDTLFKRGSELADAHRSRRS